MNAKTIQLIALFITCMFIFLPVSFVEALQITHQQNPAVSVNPTTAVIQWNTDEDANSRVDYGVTQQLGEEKTFAELTKSHSVALGNLTPETRYYFQLMSIAGSGDYKVDDNIGRFYSFITPSAGDTQAPAISGVAVISLAKTTATIKWATDENANSIIYLAEEGQPMAIAKADNTFVKDHIMTIPAAEGKKYNYIASSCDTAGNCANSTQQFLVGGADITPPSIDVSLPEYHNLGRIDISGKTEPYAKVELFVNSNRERALSPETTGAEGIILFRNVALPLEENSIEIKATDIGNNSASKDYTIKVDARPPVLNVSGISKTTTMPSVTLTIGINELCTIEIEAGVEDKTPPAKVQGLKEKRVSATLAEIEWTANTESDFSEYAVYRLAKTALGAQEWVRIKVSSQPNFQDAKVAAGQSYSYKVSAVDKRGNEGPFSDVLVVSLPAGVSSGAEIQLTPVLLSYQAKKDTFTREGGVFTKSVQLDSGINTVRVTATDRGGNAVSYTASVLYDMSPPQILSHNLEQLSPTYIPTVTVIGNVSERSIITAFVNGKAVATEETDSNGYFSFNIDLSRGNPATDAQKASISASVPVLSLVDSAIQGQITEGTFSQIGAATPLWINTVKLVATDEAGSSSQPVEEEIYYTQCGYGSWYRVEIGGQPASIYGSGGLTPSALNPRLMLEGQEIISFPINLSYQGAGKDQMMGMPSVKIYGLSQDQQKKYTPDIEWVSSPSVICDPKTQKTCLVQMTVRADVGLENWTNYMKEENISNNHLGECKVPGFGCIKIPLMLEVNFKEVTNVQGPYQQQYYPGQPTVDSKTQKQCWELEIMIDKRIDPSILPGGLLRGASDAINSTINVIDAILKPLSYIKATIAGFCALSWAASFVVYLFEAYYCSGSSGDSAAAKATQVAGAIANAASEGSFDRNIAEIGVCAAEYPDDDKNKEKRSNCLSCEDAIAAKRTLEWTMKHTCDKLFCPSAPTFQKYIKDSAGKAEKVTGPLTKKEYYMGNSCACDPANPDECKPVKNAETGYESIKKFYEMYKQDSSKEYADSDDGSEKCTGPHTAKAKCCGYEYMNEWGSACGFPYSGELLFNEIKESLCLAGQNTNQPATLQGFNFDGGGSATETVECNKLINSVAGFCEAEGKPNLEPFSTGMRAQSGTAINNIELDKDDKNLYICLFPPGGTSDRYKVQACVPTTRSKVSGNANQSSFIPLQKEFGFYPVSSDLGGLFAPKKSEEEKTNKATFCNNLMKYAQGATYSKDKCESVYNTIKNRIGDTTKEYIVDPTSSMLRSLQCVCISGIEAYLSLYKRVLQALMNCFVTIEKTGDGSPGVCEAMVSVYVCDMLFDLIKCFTEKYNTGLTGRASFEEQSTNFFSAITGAGSQVSSSISGRYGSSAMWQSIFVENKLMHAVCVFAFTGTWDLSLETLLESETSMPVVKPVVSFPVCERRFKSFNPTTTPSGLTTWNYHLALAIIPGSDIRYTVKLVCSDGYDGSCSQSEGFEQGRCDCRSGAKEMVVSSPDLKGTLSRTEDLNTEVFFQVESKEYRFNKAILEYEWTDNSGQPKKESITCDIEQVGGNAPAFCSFSIAHGAYRCGLGFDTENWVRINDAKPNYPVNQPAFKLNDKLSFVVDLQQAIPSNPDCATKSCEYTKFLAYTIKDDTGAVRYNNPEAKPLNTLGQSLVTDWPASLTVVQDFFTAQGQQAAEATACESGTPAPGFGQIADCMPGGCPSVCQTNFKIGLLGASSTNQDMVLAMDQEGNFALFKYQAGMKTTQTAPANQRAATIADTYYYNQAAKLNSGNINNIPTRTITYDNLNIQVIGAPSRYVEMVIHYTAGQTQAAKGSNRCSLFNTTEKAMARPWTINYKIYEARQIGARYEMSTQQSSYSGVPVEVTVPFYVVCSDKVTVSGVDVSRKCNQRSTSNLSQACWCSADSIAKSQTDSQTPFDCEKGKFCVDGTCGTLPACVMDGKTVITQDCICSIKDKAETKCTKNQVCTADGKCGLPNCEIVFGQGAKIQYKCMCGSDECDAGNTCEMNINVKTVWCVPYTELEKSVTLPTLDTNPPSDSWVLGCVGEECSDRYSDGDVHCHLGCSKDSYCARDGSCHDLETGVVRCTLESSCVRD